MNRSCFATICWLRVWFAMQQKSETLTFRKYFITASCGICDNSKPSSISDQFLFNFCFLSQPLATEWRTKAEITGNNRASLLQRSRKSEKMLQTFERILTSIDDQHEKLWRKTEISDPTHSEFLRRTPPCSSVFLCLKREQGSMWNCRSL